MFQRSKSMTAAKYFGPSRKQNDERSTSSVHNELFNIPSSSRLTHHHHHHHHHHHRGLGPTCDEIIFLHSERIKANGPTSPANQAVKTLTNKATNKATTRKSWPPAQRKFTLASAAPTIFADQGIYVSNFAARTTISRSERVPSTIFQYSFAVTWQSEPSR
ncbi:hypothetical protein L209DRAFT_217103 [Thermothelomyces heterothallicus CBS 203.75]